MKKHSFLRQHLFIFLLLFLIFQFWKCPSLYLFGVPCPGCGLTRAHIAALKLDFASAFYYHPLFFLAIPTIMYLSHRHSLKKKIPDKVENILAILIISLTFLVYLYRLLISKSPIVQIHLENGVLPPLITVLINHIQQKL